MQGRFKMEYRLFTIVRYNYDYRDYNNTNTNGAMYVVTVGGEWYNISDLH